MFHPVLRLVAIVSLLVTVAESRWKAGLPRALETDDPSPESDARQALEPLAPLVIKTGVCGGLTNQHVALVDGIMMGLIQGAQVLLPDDVPLDGTEGIEGIDADMHPLSDLIRVEDLSRKVNDLYWEYWCNHSRTDRMRGELWCGQNYSAIVSSVSAAAVDSAFRRLSGVDPDVKILSIPNMAMYTMAEAAAFRQDVNATIPNAFEGHRRSLLDNNCTIFNLKVNQLDSELWSLWWRTSDAFDYVDSIKEATAKFLDIIDSYSALAQERAVQRGFPPLPKRAGGRPAFNFLHFRAEEDWIEHCEKWMPLADGVHRDNCMNNTQNIAGVLVTEGLDPRVPLYIGTGLDNDGLKTLKIQGQYGNGFKGLTDAFTVVTKDDILRDLGPHTYSFKREQWAAVDLLIGSAAAEFVGNSVSTLSAYIIADRMRLGQRAWHYNGGITPLQDMGALTPNAPMSISTFREPIKWVFTIHVGRSSLSRSYVDMVKVAVLSALNRTHLVPVCVTTEGPHSQLSTWLVSHGVRVVNHWPTWANALHDHHRTIRPENGTRAVSLASHPHGDADVMIGTALRMDIPIIGMLDEFVLYTDVDIMFRSDITWKVLLANMDFNTTLARNDFARGLRAFAERTPAGRAKPALVHQHSMPPLLLSAELRAGVMVMNMRMLRVTYDDIKAYVMRTAYLERIPGLESRSTAQAFSSSPLGTPQTFLPRELDWKAYWKPNPDAKIIHFRGPKCTRDIEPYLARGEVRSGGFQLYLRQCVANGNCARLCEEFQRYLTASGSS